MFKKKTLNFETILKESESLLWNASYHGQRISKSLIFFLYLTHIFPYCTIT